MARDIEEFLRRAAERRQQQKGGGAPQQRQPEAPPQSKPEPPPQRQTLAEPLRQQTPERPMVVEDVEIVENRPVRSKIGSQIKTRSKLTSIRSGSVSDHVKSHINTSQIAEHAAQLGERISGVHDEVESRIHGRLDSDLSVIDDTPTVTDDESPKIFGAATDSKAVALRAMLSNPTSVGQAILVAEILKRPDFDD